MRNRMLEPRVCVYVCVCHTTIMFSYSASVWLGMSKTTAVNAVGRKSIIL